MDASTPVTYIEQSKCVPCSCRAVSTLEKQCLGELPVAQLLNAANDVQHLVRLKRRLHPATERYRTSGHYAARLLQRCRPITAPTIIVTSPKPSDNESVDKITFKARLSIYIHMSFHCFVIQFILLLYRITRNPSAQLGGLSHPIFSIK